MGALNSIAMKNNNANAVTPEDLVFTSEEASGGGLLTAGEHRVTIESVAMVTPSSKSYEFAADPTPQLQFVFKNDEGQFSDWKNLRGYKKYEELSATEKKSGKYVQRGDYAVVKATGKRIVDDERTAKAMAMVGNLGFACGIERGQSFKPSDLVGSELTIIIGPSADRPDQLRVKAVKAIGSEDTHMVE